LGLFGDLRHISSFELDFGGFELILHCNRGAHESGVIGSNEPARASTDLMLSISRGGVLKPRLWLRFGMARQ
jgi:hypothetical protein